MSLRYGVFPVTVKDMRRQTALTVEQIRSIVDHTARYWADMSRNAEFPLFRVFDWTALPFTLSMKQRLDQAELGERARDAVGRRWRFDTTSGVFDRVVVILDDGISTSGVTNPDPILGAVDFTPALLQHEMGHVYQAGHSSLFNPKPPPYSTEYADDYCVMGGEGNKLTYPEPSCVFENPRGGDPDTAHAASGPGMCVPWLARAGWLAVGDPRQVRNETASWDRPGGGQVRLAPLHGPGADDRDRCVYLERITDDGICVFLEYRSRAGWDRGIPETQGAGGYLVAHLSLLDNGLPISAVQAGAVPARPGATMRVSGVPVRADVLAVNQDGSLQVRVQRSLFGHERIELNRRRIPH